MHLPSLLVALSVCSAWAAPLEQQPLGGGVRKHAGPNRAKNPYAPGFRDEWDRKIDSQGDKLTPEPNVSFGDEMESRIKTSISHLTDHI